MAAQPLTGGSPVQLTVQLSIWRQDMKLCNVWCICISAKWTWEVHQDIFEDTVLEAEHKNQDMIKYALNWCKDQPFWNNSRLIKIIPKDSFKNLICATVHSVLTQTWTKSRMTFDPKLPCAGAHYSPTEIFPSEPIIMNVLMVLHHLDWLQIGSNAVQQNLFNCTKCLLQFILPSADRCMSFLLSSYYNDVRR